MEELEDIEEDAGLGNGGLGRLAGKLCALYEREGRGCFKTVNLKSEPKSVFLVGCLFFGKLHKYLQPLKKFCLHFIHFSVLP